MHKSVAIVGYAPSSRLGAADLPKNVEIWSMNDMHSFIDEASLWFQIHTTDKVDGSDPKMNARQRPEFGSGEHVEWLRSTKIPVMMIDKDPEFPSSQRYPLEKVWPFEDHAAYFTCTPAYMIAYAIYQGYKEIHLFGIDLTFTEEYQAQKSCVEFWIGVAMTKGIQVNWPDSSPLLMAPLYGRTSEAEGNLRAMAQDRLRGHKDEYMRAWSQLVRAVASFETASEVVSRLQIPDLAVKAQLTNSLRIKQEKVGAANATMHATVGLVRETMHWASSLGITDLVEPRLPDMVMPEDIEIETGKTAELVTP